MSWYLESIVIANDECHQIEYTISFTSLLSRIYHLKEEQINQVIIIDSSYSNIHRGEFELLMERTLSC